MRWQYVEDEEWALGDWIRNVLQTVGFTLVILISGKVLQGWDDRFGNCSGSGEVNQIAGFIEAQIRDRRINSIKPVLTRFLSI